MARPETGIPKEVSAARQQLPQPTSMGRRPRHRITAGCVLHQQHQQHQQQNVHSCQRGELNGSRRSPTKSKSGNQNAPKASKKAYKKRDAEGKARGLLQHIIEALLKFVEQF
jgi:hypothetical protein